MFSGFRQAVESLAAVQHSPKSSQDASSSTADSSSLDTNGAARSSLDAQSIRASLSSSSQLAEVALSNLRKSLITQRPASPAQRPGSPASGQGQRAASGSVSVEQNAGSGSAGGAGAGAIRSSGSRTTLEDRLRAKFSIGDASNASTPASSIRSSPIPASSPSPAHAHTTATAPVPVLVTEHPLSPASTPLPESPAIPSVQDPLSPVSEPFSDSPTNTPTIVAPIPRIHDTLEMPPQDLSSSVSADDAEQMTPLDDKPLPQSESKDVESAVSQEGGSVSDEVVPEETHDDTAPHPTSEPESAEDPTILETSLPSEFTSDDTPQPSEDSDETAADKSIEAEVVVPAAFVPAPQDASPIEDPPVPPHEDAMTNDIEEKGEDIATTADASSGHANEDAEEAALVLEVASVPTLTVANVTSPDIEALQRRLQLVEQRFAGGYR